VSEAGAVVAFNHHNSGIGIGASGAPDFLDRTSAGNNSPTPPRYWRRCHMSLLFV
jgi:hypothetical protein